MIKLKFDFLYCIYYAVCNFNHLATDRFSSIDYFKLKTIRQCIILI